MARIAVKPFKTSLAFYRTRHRSPGCRITHMLGVPLLLLTGLSLLTSHKRLSLTFGLSGAILQFLGHWLFEKNEPTLIETHDLMSVPASFVFVGEQWRDVFQGTWIEKNGMDLWSKTAISHDVEEEAYSLPVRVEDMPTNIDRSESVKDTPRKVVVEP